MRRAIEGGGDRRQHGERVDHRRGTGERDHQGGGGGRGPAHDGHHDEHPFPTPAIGDRRVQRLDYRDAQGKGSERQVWPIALYFWGGTWTLGAQPYETLEELIK